MNVAVNDFMLLNAMSAEFYLTKFLNLESEFYLFSIYYYRLY